MSRLGNVKVKTLLIGSFATLAFLMVVCGSGGLLTTHHVAEQMRTFSVQDFTVGKIRLLMESNRSQILQALQHNPVSVYAQMHDHPLTVHFDAIKTNTEEIGLLWGVYQGQITSAEEKAIAAKWYEESGKLGVQSIRMAAKEIQDNNWDNAQNILIKTINPTYRRGNEVAQNLSEFLSQRTTNTLESVQQEIEVSSMAMIIALVVGVAISIVAGLLTLRAIMRPLHNAITIADRVAKGDLRGNVEVDSTNEFGHLLGSLKEMNANLVNIVSQVRSGTDTIATSSHQIANGNLDLSSRTEQQAASLEETASSMEELTSTAKQNGDNARQAEQLATKASDTAASGGKIVKQVVDTMGDINESSRQIRDIIGVIDGIAFQTNILALNAAVEAARAGEQGRGFAVVASEVRSLAQRSANAAKEIKDLIGSSVDKIELGSKLVDRAGLTMVDIINSVKQVSDIMSEINAASQEQLSGVSEISRAVIEMDTATQRNAAMVEEAAAASGALQDQAVHLAKLVGSFQLDAMKGNVTTASAEASSTIRRTATLTRSSVDTVKRLDSK